MHPHTQLDFPHNYSVNLLNQVPDESTGKPILYYPGAAESGANEGIIVEVAPQSNSNGWIGVFAFGYPEDEYSECNGIYSCPDRNSICVVADGDAFIVDATAPKNWTIVRCTPVLAVKSLVEHELLLFADFSSIWAWSSQGLSWYANVAHDGLKIEGVSGSAVYGRAFGPVPGKEDVQFQVELRTGKVSGGNCI